MAKPRSLARIAPAPLLALPWRQLARPLVLAALLTVIVVAANLLALRLSPHGYTLDVGTRQDRVAVPGFHGPERDQAGTTYRWSNGNASLLLYGPVSSGTTLTTLTLGWLPPGTTAPRRVTLALDGQPWTSLAALDQPRRYTFLLPPDALADGAIQLGLRSDTTVATADARPLGVRVDAAALSWSAGGWYLPPFGVLSAHVGLTFLWVVLARHLGLRRRATASVTSVLLVSLVAYTALVPGLAPLWLGRLLGAGLVSAASIWGAGRVLARAEPTASSGFRKALLLLTLAALALRLLGVLYPLFFSHDLLVNGGWLHSVQLGNLSLFDRPSEFSRRIVAISPTAYILALPVALVGDQGLAIQGLYTLLDGTTPLLVALLARRLGLGERAALVAAALLALLPMQFTILYWGFVRQIVGQWLTLCFMVVLAGAPPRRTVGWLVAGTLSVVNLLIHPGGLLLAGVAVGLYLLAGFVVATATSNRPGRPQGPPVPPAVERRRGTGGPCGRPTPHLAYWRGWSLNLLGASAVALGVQYAEAARLMVGGLLDDSTASPNSTSQLTDQAARLNQIWVGLDASFAPLPLALVGVGLGALLWRTQGRARLLVAAWLGSALLFLLVDIVTGQQVRYGYFSAPIVCAGVAALLEPVLSRRMGLIVAWTLVAVVAVAGVGLWTGAILYGVKPSVNPLTH
ncbi:MAG: hypothetical protein WCG26_03060 [Chloroflexales bacterium]